MIGKTEQTTGDNSAAYQSNGDMTVHHYGMDFQNVKQLCLALINDNAPKLQQEAMQSAINNVLEFAEQLRIEIEKINVRISPSKLTEPDVQAALNDAVQGAAIKGQKSDLNLLASLVASRLDTENSDLLDITIEQAIKIIPKLTRSHLDFLAVKHLISHMSITSSELEVIYSRFESLANPVLTQCGGNCILTEGNIQYLAGVGVLTYTPMFSHDVWEVQHNPYLKLEADKERFKAGIEKNAPSFFSLIQTYEKNKFPGVQLNSFGMAIALTRLSNLLGPLDLKTWIN